jgi:glycosyltransferase involved in cell wall biosynthesis
LKEVILVTSAHNEAGLIEKTIKSVLNQEIKPVKWIIIDDGSSDNTGNCNKIF